jgi:hypothetical protein
MKKQIVWVVLLLALLVVASCKPSIHLLRRASPVRTLLAMERALSMAFSFTQKLFEGWLDGVCRVIIGSKVDVNADEGFKVGSTR